MQDGEQPARRPYRSVRREEQARQTRRRILAAATAVFLARGYSGATMQVIAREAGVSVPTVELLFGTKARVLSGAIDVAIAGDDDDVPVLRRPWASAALAARTGAGLLAVAASVIGPAQVRSAGLVLAVFEGAATSSELAELAGQLAARRSVTAGWIADALSRKTPLRADCSQEEATETLWLLMDPAIYVRLVQHRRWTPERYQTWFARSAARLLIPDPAAPPTLEGMPP